MHTITEMKKHDYDPNSTPKGSRPLESTPLSTTSQKAPAPKSAIMPAGGSGDAPGHKSGLPYFKYIYMHLILESTKIMKD